MGKCLLIVLLLVSANARAAECSKLDGYAAETVTDYLDSWDNVHRAYQQFSHCDDGGVAEGFSDSVVHLLATKWSTLPQLAAMVDKEPRFRAFVVGHINATTQPDELKQIVVLASSQCPAQLTQLCKDLKSAAENALSE